MMILFYLSGEKKKGVGECTELGAKRREFPTTWSDAASLGLCFPIFNGIGPMPPCLSELLSGQDKRKRSLRRVSSHAVGLSYRWESAPLYCFLSTDSKDFFFHRRLLLTGRSVESSEV